MPSSLNKQRDYKNIAEKYAELNEPQIEYGKRFVNLLGVTRGDNVLDMGCGTGEITSFIADQVGEEGEVIGVDPDQERIRIATGQQHYGTKRNIKFIVGDSSSRFRHFKEGYYDIHFSSFVFQWLTIPAERDAFLKTAYKCLKPGGEIAILNTDEYPEILTDVSKLLPDHMIEKNSAPRQYIKKVAAESILEKSGFTIRLSEYINGDVEFPSMETFLAWFCASDYIDESKIVPYKMEEFAKKFVNDDGTVSLLILEMQLYRIIAEK